MLPPAGGIATTTNNAMDFNKKGPVQAPSSAKLAAARAAYKYSPEPDLSMLKNPGPLRPPANSILEPVQPSTPSASAAAFTSSSRSILASKQQRDQAAAADQERAKSPGGSGSRSTCASANTTLQAAKDSSDDHIKKAFTPAGAGSFAHTLLAKTAGNVQGNKGSRPRVKAQPMTELPMKGSRLRQTGLPASNRQRAAAAAAAPKPKQRAVAAAKGAAAEAAATKAAEEAALEVLASLLQERKMSVAGEALLQMRARAGAEAAPKKHSHHMWKAEQEQENH